MTSAEHYAAEAAYQDTLTAVERREFNLVSVLGLTPYPDGNQWCVLWGENLQEGVAGFGDTPYLAILAFNKAVASERARNDRT